MKILNVILIVAIVVVGYLWLTKSPDVVYDTSQSDSLEIVISNQDIIINKSVYFMDSLDTVIYYLRKDRENINNQLINLRKEYNAQVQIIDSNSVLDDINFFSSEFISDSTSN